LTLSTVAVIVTCYNQERFIRQALDSILTQTQPADEIVVIDGFSQDRSVSAITEWIAENDASVTFVAHDRNYGLCATLNQAMGLITSEFVVTLYGDDWLEPQRLETQSAVLAAASDDVCMVVSSMREVDRRGIPILVHDFRGRVEPLASLAPAARVESLVGENVIPSPAVMIRADRVREVGGYDESLTFDDYDMWMRLLGQYTLVYEPSVVVDYRILAQSLSRNTDRQGDFLLSEARMIYKHSGTTPTIDATIRMRLLVSAEKLAERRDTRRLREVLSMLRSIDSSWSIRIASLASRLPQGARLVKSMNLLETDER
jgi:glycosyltransferase involved in cell wall biosynthesis